MSDHETFYFERVDSPVDQLVLAVDDSGRLRILEFADHDERMNLLMRRQYRTGREVREGRVPATIRDALERYFLGDLTATDALETKTGGTDFQRRVWAALREIPAGTTESYGALARRLGAPDASRAVGLANGQNPVAIVVPCHRVIGANGSLTGFGGGLPRKQWLLNHEGAAFQPMRAKPSPGARLPGL